MVAGISVGALRSSARSLLTLQDEFHLLAHQMAPPILRILWNVLLLPFRGNSQTGSVLRFLAQVRESYLFDILQQ